MAGKTIQKPIIDSNYDKNQQNGKPTTVNGIPTGGTTASGNPTHTSDGRFSSNGLFKETDINKLRAEIKKKFPEVKRVTAKEYPVPRNLDPTDTTYYPGSSPIQTGGLNGEKFFWERLAVPLRDDYNNQMYKKYGKNFIAGDFRPVSDFMDKKMNADVIYSFSYYDENGKQVDDFFYIDIKHKDRKIVEIMDFSTRFFGKNAVDFTFYEKPIIQQNVNDFLPRRIESTNYVDLLNVNPEAQTACTHILFIDTMDTVDSQNNIMKNSTIDYSDGLIKRAQLVNLNQYKKDLTDEIKKKVSGYANETPENILSSLAMRTMLSKPVDNFLKDITQTEISSRRPITIPIKDDNGNNLGIEISLYTGGLNGGFHISIGYDRTRENQYFNNPNYVVMDPNVYNGKETTDLIADTKDKIDIINDVNDALMLNTIWTGVPKNGKANMFPAKTRSKKQVADEEEEKKKQAGV